MIEFTEEDHKRLRTIADWVESDGRPEPANFLRKLARKLAERPAGDGRPAATITIRDDGDSLDVRCHVQPDASEFNHDDELPETHQMAALMMQVCRDDSSPVSAGDAEGQEG